MSRYVRFLKLEVWNSCFKFNARMNLSQAFTSTVALRPVPATALYELNRDKCALPHCTLPRPLWLTLCTSITVHGQLSASRLLDTKTAFSLDPNRHGLVLAALALGTSMSPALGLSR